MRKVLSTLRNIKSTYINHLTEKMDPAMLFGHLDPTNNFAMGGLPMALARELLLEGKPLPKTLFLNVILIEHIKNHHLGLSLTMNISKNTAIIRMYDNFATINSQLLHVTLSNHSDLENQLWRLYIEVNGIIHDFMPDIDDMPPSEDIPEDEI